MKVWKSPVFYFGVILLLAVVSAMMAPFVVDWNSYRADLETYGRKLTGREVSIEGPIAVRLFPWPRLVAEDVHVANQPGRGDAEFASASRIVVRVTLAGLFSGKLHVESVDIEQPSITLERLEAGKGNWSFVPAADLVRSELLNQVKLDRINLHGGRLKLIDHKRGGEAQLEGLEASLSAPGITGPWRMRASANYRGQPLDIALNTGSWDPDEPFRFGLRVSPGGGPGLAYSFDGANDGNHLKGMLRIEPVVAADGTSHAESPVLPLVFRSEVSADFDEIALDKIEVSPRDLKDGGTLMTGSARLVLGADITASAELAAARIDLDQLAGAGARNPMRDGSGLVLADNLLALLPERIDLKATLKVTSLKTGGEALENVVMRVEAGSDAIRVRELSASLPGRSRVLFNGVFFPGKSGAELGGRLAVESNDLRQLALWAWPEGKDTVTRMWTGSRGRLKLQTDVSLTATRLRFARTQYEIDGAAGSGELTANSGGSSAVDLRLDARLVDIDSFVPQGISAVSSGGKTGLAGLLAILVPGADASDLRLTLQAGKLLLNGVEAADVTVDLASGSKGLDLRMLEIGSVGGARLQSTGLILDTGKGPDGSVGVEVEAQDPRGLLKLLGFMPAEAEPPWAAALGATRIKGTLSVKPGDAKPSVSFDLDGTTGALEVAASGSLTGAPSFAIRAAADIKSAKSASLMQLLGLVPATDDQSEGRLTVTMAGTVSEGFAADIQAQVYGSRFSYNGRVEPAPTGLGLAGEFSARSTDLAPLLAAAGLPSLTPPSGILVLDAKLENDKGRIVLPAIEGRFGEAKLGGNLVFEGKKITGSVEVGELALIDVMTAAFLAWTGRAPRLDSAFADGPPFGLSGELWIKPSALRVQQNFTVSDAQIGITASPEETRVAVFGKARDGRDAAIEIGSRKHAGSRRLDGKLTLPFDLAQQLRLTDGSPIADGDGLIDIRFEAEGLSAGGAMSAMKGSGSYAFKDVKLRNISPPSFTRLLAAAKDKPGLDAAFDGLRHGDGLAVGTINGSITVYNGVASFLPFALRTADADVSVTTVGEIGQGLIDAAVTLNLKARPNLPAMEISYAGAPDALTRNEDTAEVAAQLGFSIMEQGVKELERLQKEQQRLAVEEERMRKEDEAKLQAYYAQRDEIRMRQRELKVHAEMRVVAAEKLRREIEQASAANAEINKKEVGLRARQLRVHRRMAKLARPVPVIVKPPSQ